MKNEKIAVTLFDNCMDLLGEGATDKQIADALSEVMMIFLRDRGGEFKKMYERFNVEGGI
jgi:hypothetical protein